MPKPKECEGCKFEECCGGIRDQTGKCPSETGGEPWAIKTPKGNSKDTVDKLP